MGNGCLGAQRSNVIRDTLELESNVRRKEQHLGQNLVDEVFQTSVFDVYDTSKGPILGSWLLELVSSLHAAGLSCSPLSRHGHLRRGAHSLPQGDQEGLCAEDAAHQVYPRPREARGEVAVELQNEVRIMSELDHPNIIRLFEVYQSSDHLYLIMELCTGGELLDRCAAGVGGVAAEESASLSAPRGLLIVPSLGDTECAASTNLPCSHRLFPETYLDWLCTQTE
eukprot:scaffold803_cov310-Pinguiococcus_pyrenoidosus.AAC.105